MGKALIYTPESLRIKGVHIGKAYEVFTVDSKDFKVIGTYKVLALYPHFILTESLKGGYRECFVNNKKLVRLKG